MQSELSDHLESSEEALDTHSRRATVVARFADIAAITLIAAIVVFAAVDAQLGIGVSSTTPILVAAVVLSGIVCIASALLARPQARQWGTTTLIPFAFLVLFTGLSIVWSISPDHSWFEANRTFAYFAVFAAGIAGARLAPARWQAVLGGVLLGGSVVLIWALLSKVFPAQFDSDFRYARLAEPIKYWNALGSIAGANLVLSLWLGTRVEGKRALNALAYPLVGISVVVLLLTLSRGGILGTALGLVVWLLISHRRLHSIMILVIAGTAGSLVAAWALKNDSLTTDRLAENLRIAAGHDFGMLALVVVAILLIVGLVIELSNVTALASETHRRRIGIAIAAVAAVFALGGVVRVAASDRGLTGTVSHTFNQLTDTSVDPPGNEASRLSQVGSYRAAYWDQALKLYKAQKSRGLGAGTFFDAQPRVRSSSAAASQAHGYVVQTLADLGLIGTGLSLAATALWLIGAAVAVGLVGPLKRVLRTGERDGAAAMVAAVFVAGTVSFVDWTWFQPGVTMPMMLLAGWVVGRGAQAVHVPAELPMDRTALAGRVAVAIGIAVITLAGLVSLLQPSRSIDLQNKAINQRDEGNLDGALKNANSAIKADPLSADARYTLANVLVAQKKFDQADKQYEYVAVKMLPAVPNSWVQLASYRLNTADKPEEALKAVGVALKMAPTLQSANTIALAASEVVQARKLEKQRQQAAIRELARIQARKKAAAEKAKKAAAAAK